MDIFQQIAVKKFGHQVLPVSDEIVECLNKNNGVFIPWQYPDWLDALCDAWPLVCIKDPTVYPKHERFEVVSSFEGRNCVSESKPSGWFLMRGTKAYRKFRDKNCGGWGTRKNEDIYAVASWLGKKFCAWHLRTGKHAAVIRAWRQRDQHYSFQNASVEKAFRSEFRNAFFVEFHRKTGDYDHCSEWQLQIQFGRDGSFYMLYDPKNQIDRRMLFDALEKAQETAVIENNIRSQNYLVSAR